MVSHPKQVLSNALTLLKAKGWAQNALTDEAGRLCLRGAILKASEGNDTLAIQSLAAVFKNGAQGVFYTESGVRNGIEGWNDAPIRTFSQVEALLKDTIKNIDWILKASIKQAFARFNGIALDVQD